MKMFGESLIHDLSAGGMIVRSHANLAKRNNPTIGETMTVDVSLIYLAAIVVHVPFKSFEQRMGETMVLSHAV